MNIVLDFLPFMYDGRTRGIGGVASFAKSFYNEIIRQKDTTTRLFALYDSSFSVGKQYDYQQIYPPDLFPPILSNSTSTCCLLP